MAKKTLESNRKRKPEDDAVTKIKNEITDSKKKEKTSSKTEDSSRRIDDEKEKTKKKAKEVKSPVKKSAKKVEGKEVKSPIKKSDKKVEGKEVKSPVKNSDKKVKTESPVKKSGKEEDVEVKKLKKVQVKKEEDEDGNEGGALYTFPMNRVNRIIRSENPDIRMHSETVFLINKATEKFLELFSKEAYTCASRDHTKKIDYKHLSSLIPKERKFDFLSDFIPVKVKAADALKEIQSVDTNLAGT